MKSLYILKHVLKLNLYFLICKYFSKDFPSNFYFKTKLTYLFVVLICIIVQVKSAVRITQSQTFLDFIFLMQVSLGNKKCFDKWSKTLPIYQNFALPLLNFSLGKNAHIW